jgi:hypothetical protein
MTKNKADDQLQLLFEEQFFGQWTEGDVEVCQNDTTEDEEVCQNEAENNTSAELSSA